MLQECMGTTAMSMITSTGIDCRFGEIIHETTAWGSCMPNNAYTTCYRIQSGANSLLLDKATMFNLSLH